MWTSGRLGRVELDGVADEVLEELAELGGVGGDGRQRVVRDLRAGFRDRRLEVVQGAGEHGPAVDRLERPALRVRRRE